MTLLDAFARYRAALQLADDDVSRESWYRWVRTGRVPSITLPSDRRRIRASDLEALIAAGGVAE